MITVPARRVKQFGVEFYQAGLSAKDIDRLVKFEVLGYSGGPANDLPKKTRVNRSRVNWDSLEKRIGESETAYQRPGRPQALPGREPGARARRDPLAQRGRYLAAPRRDQDARHRPRARESGAAGRGDRRLLRDRREGRQRRQAAGAAGRRQALLPELHQGALDHVPDRLGGAQVLDQDRRRAARLHPDGARRDGARPRAAARSVRSERDPRGDQAVGRASARPALRDRGRVEAEARRRHARNRGGPHARAARRAALARAAPSITSWRGSRPRRAPARDTGRSSATPGARSGNRSRVAS